MFEQHPVPQQISSYEFRLVGDMTLKQFFQLAGGVGIGLLFYASPLPAIFKWPLIVFFVVIGAAFAFLPFQDRPLQQWVAAFFRAVYGPTEYKWSKIQNVSFFAPDANPLTSASSSAGSTAVNNSEAVSKLESIETSFLNNISGMFSLHPKPTASSVVQASQATTSTSQLNGARVISASLIPEKRPGELNQFSIPPSIPAAQAGSLSVATPFAAPIAIQKKDVAEYVAATPIAPTGNITTSAVAQTLNTKGNQEGSQAMFSLEAAPPAPATIPNVIVGQVLSFDGKIVDGAILEVKDFQGRPVRAFKTNKAGHFTIVTPLPNGTYSIIVEKDGEEFDQVNFEAHGALIQPIAIRAKQKK